MKRLFILLSIATMSLSSCKNDNGCNAVIENIMTRTSVRSYKADPVPEDMIETMLRAGMAAPSAMNRQPWEFIVVDDRATLDTLADKLRYAKMLVQAPLAIVICSETMITTHEGIRVENRFWTHDASAAAENILLAAHALGLGAVWTAAADPERSAIVCEALGLDGTVKPLCVIPVGFPDGPQEPKDKWKPEKIHYNRW